MTIRSEIFRTNDRIGRRSVRMTTPTPPIVALFAAFQAEAVNSVYRPNGWAIISGSFALWRKRCSWIEHIGMLYFSRWTIISFREFREFRVRQLSCAMWMWCLWLMSPFFRLTSGGTLLVGFGVSPSLESFVDTIGWKGRKSGASTLERFKELFMFSNGWNSSIE